MRRRIVLCLVLALATARNAAADMENGIYAVLPDGAGQRVPKNGGGELFLGKRLSGNFGKAKFRSMANDNAWFALALSDAGPVAKDELSALALVIDGVCAAVSSRSAPNADGTVNLDCRIVDEKAARQAAAVLKAELKLRKHPGHRFTVRWLPVKDALHFGDPVVLKLEIRNVGDQPFAFQVGGKQRGSRDNQFRFLAYHSAGGGKAVPDSGNPDHFGGKSSLRTLKPGETFEKTVSLDKWFHFLTADTYRITGMYELEMYDPAADRPFREVIWDDLAVGDCLVKIAPRK